MKRSKVVPTNEEFREKFLKATGRVLRNLYMGNLFVCEDGHVLTFLDGAYVEMTL